MKKLVIIFVLFLCQFFGYTKEQSDKLKLKLEVSSNIGSLEGWCSVEKAMHMIDLVLEVKPKVCVEIGVFGGRSLYPVAAALQLLEKGFVIAIDPWDRFEAIRFFDPNTDEQDLRWWGKLNIDFIYSSYLHMLSRFDLEPFVETIRDTAEMAQSHIDEEIDILHLDGNHCEEPSTLDVVLYLPKVRQGGYIWMNDALWERRKEAVELLKESCDIVKQIEGGNCILFQKR